MNIDIEALVKQAQEKQQIVRITIYPNVDVIPNIAALTDADDLVEVAFEPVPKP